MLMTSLMQRSQKVFMHVNRKEQRNKSGGQLFVSCHVDHMLPRAFVSFIMVIISPGILQCINANVTGIKYHIDTSKFASWQAVALTKQPAQVSIWPKLGQPTTA